MDKLKQLVASKRKATEEEFGGRKFMKREELEEMRLKKLREEEDQERQTKEQKKREIEQQKQGSSKQSTTAASTHGSTLHATTANATVSAQQDQPDPSAASITTIDIQPTEIVRRLRLLKQPITLFGETPEQRYHRLIETEKNMHFDDEMTGGQQENLHTAFLREQKEKSQFLHILKSTQDDNTIKKKETHLGDDTTVTNNNNNNGNGVDASIQQHSLQQAGITIRTDHNSNTLDRNNNDAEAQLMASFKAAADFVAEKNMPVEDRVTKWLKKWMEDWKIDLENRPAELKLSAAGRQADMRYRETMEYLRPLYSRLRNRSLDPTLLAGIKLIVDLIKQRNYLYAYKVYMGVAIGNSPWPIGVTHVGLHERSAREKISFKYASGNAHIMNDEATRKFIQALKRIMTFCQRRYPTDPSRSVDFDGVASQGWGAEGGDKASLLKAMARGEELRPAPAPAHLDEVTGGVKVPEKWDHIIKEALKEVAGGEDAEEAQEAQARLRRMAEGGDGKK